MNSLKPTNTPDNFIPQEFSDDISVTYQDPKNVLLKGPRHYQEVCMATQFCRQRLMVGDVIRMCDPLIVM